MEIKKYFKEGSKNNDFTRDYVEIKMSYENYVDLFYLVERIRIKNKLNKIQLDQTEKKIIKEIRDTVVEEVWY